ncbi:MAG: alpha/beta hydrolase [Candidatus Lokiarchaeota archaeon]|nr:alpha/beta hydrolase [Candidatus Lokiarchaeota archaeon]
MDLFNVNDQIQIAYSLSGNTNGPKMVLLHGLFLNSDCWKFQLSEFEPKFQILRFDLRGHGRSTKPPKRFTIRDYVDDMRKLLEFLHWNTELYLVGHSLGGMIALVYAVENPEQIKKMVIADSFCHVTHDATTDVISRVNNNPLDKFAMGISTRGLKPYDKEIAEYIASMVTDYMTKEDCLTATAASAGFSMCKYLKQIEIPTLVLVGNDDITTPVWASGMIHDWLQNSELTIIPNSGHLTIFDHPKEFNQLTISFWEKE